MTQEKIIDLLKQYWRYLLTALAAGIVAFGFSAFSGKGESAELIDLTTNTPVLEGSKTQENQSEETLAEASQDSGTIVVDVKGAVKNPSVYKVNANLRVNDVIQLAGGLSEQADPKSINLAGKLKDAQVIYVATVGEAAPSVADGEVASNTSEQENETGKVNINTADSTELQTLSGIGVKKAQDIIDYRTQNGPFKTIDDLKNVSGFGDKTMEKLKESITVD